MHAMCYLKIFVWVLTWLCDSSLDMHMVQLWILCNSGRTDWEV